MIITIVNEFGNGDVQAWTFDIKESDLVDLMQKYEGCGEGVLLDADELPEDFREYYK